MQDKKQLEQCADETRKIFKYLSAVAGKRYDFFTVDDVNSKQAYPLEIDGFWFEMLNSIAYTAYLQEYEFNEHFFDSIVNNKHGIKDRNLIERVNRLNRAYRFIETKTPKVFTKNFFNSQFGDVQVFFELLHTAFEEYIELKKKAGISEQNIIINKAALGLSKYFYNKSFTQYAINSDLYNADCIHGYNVICLTFMQIASILQMPSLVINDMSDYAISFSGLKNEKYFTELITTKRELKEDDLLRGCDENKNNILHHLAHYQPLFSSDIKAPFSIKNLFNTSSEKFTEMMLEKNKFGVTPFAFLLQAYEKELIKYYKDDIVRALEEYDTIRYDDRKTERYNFIKDLATTASRLMGANTIERLKRCDFFNYENLKTLIDGLKTKACDVDVTVFQRVNTLETRLFEEFGAFDAS